MSTPRIESYRFGHIQIDGQEYSKDLLIIPDGVLPDWWREMGHELHRADLDRVLAGKPEILVIGQGRYGRMAVPEDVVSWLVGQGIQVHCEETQCAVETYNQLRAHRRTAAALHLTC